MEQEYNVSIQPSTVLLVSSMMGLVKFASQMLPTVQLGSLVMALDLAVSTMRTTVQQI